jgi:hypothetical protein
MFERTGPLAQLIPGIGVLAARAANVDDIIGIRVLFTLLAAASVSLAYLLGRDFCHSRLAGLASAAALLCFEGFIYFASNGPSEKTAMVLFRSRGIRGNINSSVVNDPFVNGPAWRCPVPVNCPVRMNPTPALCLSPFRHRFDLFEH